MASTAVAKKEASKVPALVTPTSSFASEIDASDIAFSRMYIAQYSTKAVKNKKIDIEAGDIFVAQGNEDPEPILLWREGQAEDEGPVIYMIGMKKGKSYSEQGGELEIYDFDDPMAPEKAWVTYNYTIVIPSVDEDMPFKWLCTKTGKASAMKINMTIKKNAGRYPDWANAFRITTAFRSNPKGDYYVPMVTNVEADPEHVDLAGALAELVGASTSDIRSTTEEPAI